jgi:hypothetical protein
MTESLDKMTKSRNLNMDENNRRKELKAQLDMI